PEDCILRCAVDLRDKVVVPLARDRKAVQVEGGAVDDRPRAASRFHRGIQHGMHDRIVRDRKWFARPFERYSSGKGWSKRAMARDRAAVFLLRIDDLFGPPCQYPRGAEPPDSSRQHRGISASHDDYGPA